MAKNVVALIADLQDIKKRLELIKNDDNYIKSRVDDIYKGKRYSPNREQIENILKDF